MVFALVTGLVLLACSLYRGVMQLGACCCRCFGWFCACVFLTLHFVRLVLSFV